VNLLLPLLFFAVWAAMMGSYVYFVWHVAPSALRRWSEEQRYQLIEKRIAGAFDWFLHAKGSGHHIYRIVILDDKGQSRRGLAIMGKPFWFSFSCSGCPVDVRWDSPREVVRRREPVAQLTVFCFAAADLIIAIVLLAAMLGMLFVIALCLDEIWDGTWGLNHRLGRVPRPDARDETRLFMIQMLGVLACYLAALLTLAAGGTGMIQRRIWGYHAHLAGSALVALTGFGIIYAIPSLIISLRPEFKAYFSSISKIKSTEDSFADL
jgi:hypothetical protein